MMATNRTLLWRLGIAAAALSAAIAVYCLARFYPPALLEPFRATRSALAAQPGLFGSLPSLFYTLAMGLLVGVCTATPTDARKYCLLWIGLALLLELTQHPIVAKPLSIWLSTNLTTSIWEVVGPYWIRGTFDPIDMLATLVGGLIALALLVYRGKKERQETV
jgi:hypothetical protein